MPLWALALLFLIVPLAELYVILKVGDAIGIGWTILLLVADSLLGAWLLRSQGRAVWRRFNEILAQGRVPTREVVDGVLVIFGGAFLITPGFLTDIVGLALLLPPTRAIVRRILVRRMGRGAVAAAARPRRDYDVEGSAREYDDEPPAGTRAVSAPALALSFFDAVHDIHGTARSGATILFEGRKPEALPEGPAIEESGEGWRAELPGKLALELEPVAPEADLGDVRVRVVRVRGEAAGRRVDGMGTLSETRVPPRWEELDAVRSISALVDERHALLVLARRPRDAVGHGDEEITARLIEDDAVLAVDERSHLDRLRRQRPPAQRGPRAVGARRGVPAPRLGPGDRRLLARPGGPPGARRRVPLAPRRSRGHRCLRADAAQRATRRRVRSVLISDFGGVLTTPLQEGFLAYQEESGVSLEELGKAMGLAAEEHGDHPLFVLERGEITETEFRDRIERHLEDGFDLARLRALYFERLAPNQEMIEFIRDLRGRGLRAALLTNNVREWEPLWRAKLPELDELFELVVDSAFVGLRKPDPEIYTLTLERLGGVRADECVFVDDLEPNCEAAQALGMAAVRFVTAEQAIPEIESALRS